MNPIKKDQIEAKSRAQSVAKIKTPLFDEALTTILMKDSNNNNIFSVKNAAKLPKHT